MDIDKLEISENENKPQRTFKEKLLIAICALCAASVVLNVLIFADAVHTKAKTYSILGGIVASNNINDKKAKKQGNLGNYNISSKQNSLVDNKDGTYTLTLEFEFKNYGETGRSFSEAVSLTAYQDDKEIKPIALFTDTSAATDESLVKVRNGKTASVVLSYTVTNNVSDVNIDMVSGNDTFTYTVKLSKPQSAEE